MDDILKKFGQRLKELRKSKGLTQKEMADLMDMTDRNYQRFEYGKINVPCPPKKRSDPLWISFV